MRLGPPGYHCMDVVRALSITPRVEDYAAGTTVARGAGACSLNLSQPTSLEAKGKLPKIMPRESFSPEEPILIKIEHHEYRVEKNALPRFRSPNPFRFELAERGDSRPPLRIAL